MSPIYGAIAGWAGILLLAGLKNLKVLGEAADGITWSEASTSELAFGLAFVFGFSERLFSAVTELAESAISKAKDSTAADGTATKPAAPKTTPAVGGQGAANPAGGAPAITVTKVPIWDAATGVLTLTGTNLKTVTDVKLQSKTPNVAPIPLDVDQAKTTDVLWVAKSQGTTVGAGSYDVLIDGKPIGQPAITIAGVQAAATAPV